MSADWGQRRENRIRLGQPESFRVAMGTGSLRELLGSQMGQDDLGGKNQLVQASRRDFTFPSSPLPSPTPAPDAQAPAGLFLNLSLAGGDHTCTAPGAPNRPPDHRWAWPGAHRPRCHLLHDAGRCVQPRAGTGASEQAMTACSRQLSSHFPAVRRQPAGH